MKKHGGLQVSLHALDGQQWETSSPSSFNLKSPQYPLHMRLGGSQGQPGRGGEEKESLLCPARNRTPAAQSVASPYAGENEMDGSRNLYGRMRNAYQILVGRL
jgi:hypothetical protein